MNSTNNANPTILKKMEQEIIKEAKVEEKNVQHAIKDLNGIEKHQTKVHKAADKSQHTYEKAGKQEAKAAQALNKANRNHDGAMSNLRGAERDVQLNQQQDAKLQQDVAAKKVQVDNAVKTRELNERARDQKLSEIRSQMSSGTHT